MARPGLHNHRKFKLLQHLLQLPVPYVHGLLECLWETGYQTGDALLGGAVQVELAAQWPGEAGVLFDALLCVGFIEATAPDTYQIHDLLENAPTYVAQRAGQWAEHQKDKRCDQCATIFHSTERHARFCSHRCRQMHYRRHNQTQASVTQRDGGASQRDGGASQRDGGASHPRHAASRARHAQSSFHDNSLAGGKPEVIAETSINGDGERFGRLTSRIPNRDADGPPSVTPEVHTESSVGSNGSERVTHFPEEEEQEEHPVPGSIEEHPVLLTSAEAADGARGSEPEKEEAKPAGKKRKRAVPPPAPPGFASFWTAYPRKQAKQAAIRAWLALDPDPSLQATLLAALERHKRDEQWRRGSIYIPHPATWLNGRRWEDELGPVGDPAQEAARAQQRRFEEDLRAHEEQATRERNQL